jgi:hypothetical protein
VERALNKAIDSCKIEGTAGRMSSMVFDIKKFAPQATWEGMERAKGGDYRSMIDNLARTA